MPNLKHLRLSPIALAMFTIAAWAQAPATLTVNDVLKQQQAAQTPPTLKMERAKTKVTLDAVYGQSDHLKFDVTINGLPRAGQSIGDIVNGPTGSCNIVSYSSASQCLQLSQASRAEICPVKACWTGVRPSETAAAIPAISGFQFPPPLPQQSSRSMQGGVISIAPVPTALNAQQVGGAKP
jgi:hypothetical protein